MFSRRSPAGPPCGAAMLEEVLQLGQDGLVRAQSEVIHSGACQLVSLLLAEPATSSVRDKFTASLSFNRTIDAAARATAFRWILEVQHRAIVILGHQLDGRNAVGIVQVTQHYEQTTLLDARQEFTHALAECGAFDEAIATELVHPLHHVAA